MKLSSRLCLTHKRVTQKYRNSTLIKKKKKKNCAGIGSDRNWPILRIFWIGSDLKKWYRCIPKLDQINKVSWLQQRPSPWSRSTPSGLVLWQEVQKSRGWVSNSKAHNSNNACVLCTVSPSFLSSLNKHPSGEDYFRSSQHFHIKYIYILYSSGALGTPSIPQTH